MEPQATADLENTESATPEQTDEQVHSDMLASFADDEQATRPTTAPEETTDASAKPDLDEPTSETDPAPETAGVTLETALAELKELRELSKQSADGLGGRLGSLEQAIKVLQAATGRTKPKVRGSIERFGEFGKEYPDFAKAQVDFINGLLDELDLPGLDPQFTANLLKDAGTAAETAAERKYARLRSDACREELDETHPGWREIIGLADKDLTDGGVPPDTEYRRWLATQPEAYRNKIENSYSPLVMGRSLDKFQDWKKAQTKPKPTPSPSVSTRQQRLGSAVTAKSSGGGQTPKREMTGREAMLAEFAS